MFTSAKRPTRVTKLALSGHFPRMTKEPSPLETGLDSALAEHGVKRASLYDIHATDRVPT
jgi:hypothetical protein